MATGPVSLIELISDPYRRVDLDIPEIVNDQCFLDWHHNPGTISETLGWAPFLDHEATLEVMNGSCSNEWDQMIHR